MRKHGSKTQRNLELSHYRRPGSAAKEQSDLRVGIEATIANRVRRRGRLMKAVTDSKEVNDT